MRRRLLVEASSRCSFLFMTISQNISWKPSTIDIPPVAILNSVHYKPPALIALPTCNFVTFVDNHVPWFNLSIEAT